MRGASEASAQDRWLLLDELRAQALAKPLYYWALAFAAFSQDRRGR